MVGALAGGAIGHEAAKRNGGDVSASRIAVQPDGGRMAAVTQREDASARRGDYL